MSTTTVKHYWQLMRFHKPIGTLLLLWPTLWALWIAARGMPSPWILLVFVGGTILMRAAGCVINDVADRNFDGHVSRTKQRPLAVGAVSVKSALVLFGLLSLSAFALVLTMNRLTITLAFIGLALAMIYPFMKRFTHWPQLFLGLAFSWGIPMGFAATLNEVPPVAWVLYGASILWTLVYDTQYAMVDRADDLKIGIKSTAILFGAHDRWIISLLQIAVISLLILVGWLAQLHQVYYIGVTVAFGLALYQQHLIANREPKRCMQAFLNNNWFGLAVFIGILGTTFD